MTRRGQLRLARGLIGTLAVLCLGAAARADVASDLGGAILVFPKIVVDTAKNPQTPRGPVDTLIRISNLSTKQIALHCFWVNANGHCSNDPFKICDPNGQTSGCTDSGYCVRGWSETDFAVTITAKQPVAWLASRGARPCDPSDTSGLPCFPLGHTRTAPTGQDNGTSLVLGVPEDPFIGELKCVAVDANGVPVDRNDLIGEAEIIRGTARALLDVTAYNAIGIPALPGRNNGDNTLVLGGTGAEYSSCPNILILDHFFDGATDPVANASVFTDLTLVPCSEDFLTQTPVSTPVQFLVFNEFEQRFSTSRIVTCFEEIGISSIDTRRPERSLFSAGVSGTLTGQTRIRGVGESGHTLLGVAEEFRKDGGTAAFNLHFQGTRPGSDYIYLPPN